MTHKWKATIEMNESLARELIESQCNFSVETIRLLDEGWDNRVYLINESIIFRFPRRELGLMCMENEILILPVIAKQVNFPLSCPQWIGQPSEQYPYIFSGYPILTGKPLSDVSNQLVNDENFAATLATWLRELHDIPVIENLQLNGDQSWRLDVEKRIDLGLHNLKSYEPHFRKAGFDLQKLAKILESFKTLTIKTTLQSYLHGDLYCRHILVNPKTLAPTGLIDWGDTHFSHPGIDLAVGMIFEGPVLEIFLKTYGSLTEDHLKIMRFHSFCHSLSFLPYTFEEQNPQLTRWATLVLQRVVEELS